MAYGMRGLIIAIGMSLAAAAMASVVDPLSSERDLVGRAERDNWGVPTSFGRKGSAAVVNPPVRAPENVVFSLNGEWEILTDERSIPWGSKPFAPVPSEKLIAVGEGRDGYFCYLGGDAKNLYAFGLDVLNGTPEAASLLDGMIAYCLSGGERQ